MSGPGLTREQVDALIAAGRETAPWIATYTGSGVPTLPAQTVSATLHDCGDPMRCTICSPVAGATFATQSTPEPPTMPATTQDPPVPLDAARLREIAQAVIDALAASAKEWRRAPDSEDFQDACKQVRVARDAFEDAVTPKAILALLSRLAQSEGDAARWREDRDTLQGAVDLAVIVGNRMDADADIADAEVKRLTAALRRLCAAHQPDCDCFFCAAQRTPTTEPTDGDGSLARGLAEAKAGEVVNLGSFAGYASEDALAPATPTSGTEGGNHG